MVSLYLAVYLSAGFIRYKLFYCINGGCGMNLLKAILVVVIISFGDCTYAQNAYKNFNWGMSEMDIKNICPDLEKLEKSVYTRSGVTYNDFNVIGSYLGCIIEDRIIRPTEHPIAGNTYISQDDSLIFYLDNNKLRYIWVLSVSNILISDLVQRYGDSFQREWSTTINERVEKDVYDLFTNNDDRFILLIRWVWGTPNNMYQEIRRLLYIDRNWITRLFTDNFNTHKRERERNVQNILD
jgi:hypothetical protein